MAPPKIAITTGDPAGIGPEVCIKLLENTENFELYEPIIFGDSSVLEKTADQYNIPIQVKTVTRLEEAEGPRILDVRAIGAEEYTTGRISAKTGKAAYQYLARAMDAALGNQVDAITTGPINKEALKLAGIELPGHTEILAERTQSPRSCMMQYSDELCCSFVTCHIGYQEVPLLLTKERILEVIELTDKTLGRMLGRPPMLLCCGLNPHSGENGLFGNMEEEKIIQPAVEEAQANGIAIEGPLPPDTVFLPERREKFDCMICMYHEQGHIPLKALAFDRAVNVTLGLPIIRTSVDHGTALDIAGQGIANPGSMLEAAKLAAKLAQNET